VKAVVLLAARASTAAPMAAGTSACAIIQQQPHRIPSRTLARCLAISQPMKRQADLSSGVPGSATGSGRMGAEATWTYLP